MIRQKGATSSDNKCSNEFLIANKATSDAVKKCRRVQSQRFWVSQGFLSGQKSASKAVATSTELWSGGGSALQSEENALLLPQVTGRLSWEDRSQQLPPQHNHPTVCQHLTNQIWWFTSDWSGLMVGALMTATQAFPEHLFFCRVISSRAAPQQLVQNEHKPTLHNWPPPTIALKNNWSVLLILQLNSFFFPSVVKNNEAKI